MYCKCSVAHASILNPIMMDNPMTAVLCVSFGFTSSFFDIFQTIIISYYVMFVCLFIRIKEIWSGSECLRELLWIPEAVGKNF